MRVETTIAKVGDSINMYYLKEDEEEVYVMPRSSVGHFIGSESTLIEVTFNQSISAVVEGVTTNIGGFTDDTGDVYEIYNMNATENPTVVTGLNRDEGQTHTLTLDTSETPSVATVMWPVDATHRVVGPGLAVDPATATMNHYGRVAESQTFDGEFIALLSNDRRTVFPLHTNSSALYTVPSAEMCAETALNVANDVHGYLPSCVGLFNTNKHAMY
eukprot:Trichotokara_eunicae@DN8507_c0_g1_i1.p1